MGTLKRRIIEAMEPTEYELARRWIPVEERLPEGADGEYVLVTDGNVVGMATHRNGWSHAIGRDGWTPTHWMPLPEPPEVK